MPDLKLYTGSTKLVLAFDIGTTVSNVSYCILVPHRHPEVLAVARFPAQGVARADTKVPSLLYYDNAGSVRAAGAEVLVPHIIETAQTEGWTKAEWWKLHLRPKGSSTSQDDYLPPLPPGKSAVDILADFVKYLFDCSKTYIQECHPDLAWSSVEDSIDYVITYPGGWDEQEYLYCWAIERAGLIPTTAEGRLRVHMLTEGEAGLHFYASPLLNEEVAGQTARQGVVVIDAGGGVIGLSMFSVMSNLTCYEETAPAEWRMQGSIFVTRRAQALIERKLEGWEHSGAKDIARFTREFDQATKPVIKSDQQAAYVKVANRRTCSSRHKISSGHLKLSGDEATGLFDDSIDAIMRAFERQRKSAATPITNVFLVGGLSTNGWFWYKLQSYFTSRKIKIERPNNHINKVVATGAVLSRIAHEDYFGVAARGVGRATSVKTIDKKRISKTPLSFFRPDSLSGKAAASGAMSSHVDHDNPSVPPGGMHPGYDMIKRDLWQAKVEKAGLEKTLDTLRDQEANSSKKIAGLEHTIAELRSIVCAHEQKHRCEDLYAQGSIKEATKILLEIANTASVAVRTDKLIISWITQRLKKLGDDAMDSREYDEAAEHFSAMLSLTSIDRRDILLKRSKVRALSSRWEEALSDADEAIGLDPSCHLGYEMRHVALHGARRHAEAEEAFEVMLSKIDASPHVDIRNLRQKYDDGKDAILRIVNGTIRGMPHVLIDTATGHLYGKQQQREAFATLPIYGELLSSMPTRLDHARIREAVKGFYQYVMLSHRWEDGEPLLEEVKNVSIYELRRSSTNVKLQKFCELVRYLGFRWAWSDSSCIDKSNNVVLQESLLAMFTWYRGSSLTVVYLRGVPSESREFGRLWRSIWNTRAWTYQEYVAAETIQFYTEDWKPYLGLTIFNHKESAVVVSEMQQASGVSAEEIAALSPGLDRVREKLYLASRREATLVEDIAYSLFGIFKVAMPVMYGEGNCAVGRLLEYILNGSGDTTVLAWTGSAGSYNSCLPKNLAVYDPLVPPHVPRPIEEAEMDHIIMGLRLSLADISLAIVLHKRLKDLPQPSLAANRLRLPGIVFQLPELARAPELDPVTKCHVYRATTPTLGDIEIRTTDHLSGNGGLWLIHPWIRPLLDQEFSCGAGALDKAKQALRFVVKLRQPFGALLFAQLGRVEYKRVAADSLIMVQIRKEVSLTRLIENIRTIEAL